MQHPNEIPKVRYGGDREVRDIEARWWLSNTPGRDMVAVAKRLDLDQRWRRRVNTIFARLYTGRQLRNVYDWRSASPYPTEDPFGLGTRLGLNVVQAVIDTIASKIAKNRPRSYLLTEGGTWSLQRQAKLLMRFLDGVRMSQRVYDTMRRGFIDACVWGAGVVKVSPDYEAGEVCVERAIPDSLIVNDAEAVGGKPRTLYQKHLMHRAALATYAKGTGETALKRGRAIEDAPGWDAAKDAEDSTSEMVWVYEGWSLKGKHVIAIDHEDGELNCELWDKDYHPFAWVRWRDDTTGIWGIGVAEDLLGIQMEINKLLQRLQEIHHLMGRPIIFTKPGAKLKKNHLTNEVGIIVEAEEAPTFHQGMGASEAIYKHLWDLYAKAFEIIGVSMLDASSKLPAGLTAQVAIQEYREVGSERFVLAGQCYENWGVDIDRLEIATAREMYDGGKGKDVLVRAPGTKFIETIPWSKVDLREDSFEMKPWPTSIMPATPSGRLQRVTELYQAGLIPDRETALSLLDAPDLESTLSLQLSAIDDIKRILELITDEGEYEPPEPFINLELGGRMAQATFLKSRQLKGFPEARLDMLVRFQDACRDLAAEAAVGQPQATPGQQAGVVQGAADAMSQPQGGAPAGAPQGQPGMAGPPGLPMAAPPPVAAPVQ